MSFDQQRVDFYAQGEHCSAEDDQVNIQGCYRPTDMTNVVSVTKDVVFSGPPVKCNAVNVSALAASCNGQATISSFPSDLSNVRSSTHKGSIGLRKVNRSTFRLATGRPT